MPSVVPDIGSAPGNITHSFGLLSLPSRRRKPHPAASGNFILRRTRYIRGNVLGTKLNGVDRSCGNPRGPVKTVGHKAGGKGIDQDEILRGGRWDCWSVNALFWGPMDS